MQSARRRANDAHDGRYQLGESIASGGMGTIHRAFDRLAATEVAYKRLRVDDEEKRPRLAALFQREFDQLAQLNHPCIVKAFDFGFDELGPYYTMELLSGSDLTRIGPLPVSEAARVLRDVASALALVHARGLVHRDVCPNNVRLTASGAAKLIDFGALTPFGRSELVVGTAPFIAPENLRGERLDARTDLFSLGALAYWLLTQQVPFEARQLEELEWAWQVSPPPPSARVPAVPPELDELVLSLLARDPAARPASASHVIERLTAVARLPPELDEPAVIASYLHHPPLQGRNQVLASLSTALDELSAGLGAVLRVEGAPGLGKSALLAQLATQAQLRGFTVLRAHASLQSGNLGVARELARLALGMFPRLGRELPEQALRVTAVSEQGATSAFESVERHARIANAMSDLLLAASGHNPTVIIVDDVQLCDAGSLALLSSMCDALTEQPALLALSSAPDDFGNDLATRPLDIAARKLSLQPLSSLETRELIKLSFGQLPSSDAFADALYRRTGGNPGYCMDVLRVAIARGMLTYAGGVFALPRALEARDLPNVGGALQRFRLDANDASAMAVVQLLSVSGRALTTQELCAACALPSPVVLRALARLERQRVVLREADNVALATSELATEIERALSSEQRRRLHGTLAAMAGTGGMSAAVEAGFQLMRAGGDEALRGAQQVATAIADHVQEASGQTTLMPALEAALELLGRHGRRDRDCVALLATLSIAGFYCSYSLQQRYLERTLRALAERTGLALAIRLRRWVGPRVALWLGLLSGSLASLLRKARGDARSLLRDLEAYLAVVASACAASANTSDIEQANRLEAFLEPLSSALSPAIQVVFTFCRASLEVMRGRHLAGLEHFKLVVASLAHPVPNLDDTFRTQLQYGAYYGLAHLYLERNPSEALRLASELDGSAFFAAHAMAVRMGCALYEGDTAKAAELQARAEVLALRSGVTWSAFTGLILRYIHGMAMIDDAVSISRNLDENRAMASISPAAGLYLELARAHLLTVRGQAQQAAEAFAPLMPRASEQSLALRLLAAGAYARALREAGQPARALEICKGHEQLVPDQELEQPRLSDLLLEQEALATAELGDARSAASMLERRIAARDAEDTPLLSGSLHRDRALVALLEHDRAAFELHLEKMLLNFRRTGTPQLIQQYDSLKARAARSDAQWAAPASAPHPLDVATVYRTTPRRAPAPY